MFLSKISASALEFLDFDDDEEVCPIDDNPDMYLTF
jgi:hypothetical protein